MVWAMVRQLADSLLLSSKEGTISIINHYYFYARNMPFEHPTPIPEKLTSKPQGVVKPIAKSIDIVNRRAEIFYDKQSDLGGSLKSQLKNLVTPEEQEQKSKKSLKGFRRLTVVR